MKFLTATLFTLASCLAISSSIAAESEISPVSPTVQGPLSTDARSYFREYRLRALEKSQAATSQGATCVTPRLVCWIDETVSDGTACSCPSRRFGIIEGVVGG